MSKSCGDQATRTGRLFLLADLNRQSSLGQSLFSGIGDHQGPDDQTSAAVRRQSSASFTASREQSPTV